MQNNLSSLALNRGRQAVGLGSGEVRCGGGGRSIPRECVGLIIRNNRRPHAPAGAASGGARQPNACSHNNALWRRVLVDLLTRETFCQCRHSTFYCVTSLIS